LPAEDGYQCFPHDPSVVRKPDVSFIRCGRLPGEVLPMGWGEIPPDLAVEVVSSNDSAGELEEKLDDYQKAGVPLLWVVNLKSRTVMVYGADGSVSRRVTHATARPTDQSTSLFKRENWGGLHVGRNYGLTGLGVNSADGPSSTTTCCASKSARVCPGLPTVPAR
jgi:Uma2 family endonuclease